ncbi:MAG: sugar phosphate isomerase/epimerase family protein, partial [Bacillota bacterium]
RLPLKESLEKAREVGAHGVQLWVASGELDPDNITETGKKDLLHHLEVNNLEISAVCGDIGGFANPEGLEERIAKTKRIVDLSLSLDTPIITTHIGTIPENWRQVEQGKMMLEAAKEVAKYAENHGAFLASETGPESPELMKDFLDAVESKGIAVNYDPANLVMRGFDYLGGVKVLAPYIVHTHAKDGVRIDGKGQEVALGDGHVNWDAYIAAMRDIGFNGFFTIEREVGPDPVADIKKAADFLRKY